MSEDTAEQIGLSPEETQAAFDAIGEGLRHVGESLTALNTTLPVLAPKNEVDAKVSAVMAEARAMEKRFRDDRRNTRWLMAGVGLLLVAVITGLFFIRGQQGVQERLTKENSDLTAQIRDCIEPTGQCYKQSQAQTGAAVGEINAKTIANTVVLCDLLRRHGVDPATIDPCKPYLELLQ